MGNGDVENMKEDHQPEHGQGGALSKHEIEGHPPIQCKAIKNEKKKRRELLLVFTPFYQIV